MAKKKLVSRTPTTTAPEDPDAYYWKSCCSYEKQLCENLMGQVYNQFVIMTDPDFTESLSWKELMYRLRRVRSHFIGLNMQATPEQCLEKFMEDLPDGYLND